MRWDIPAAALFMFWTWMASIPPAVAHDIYTNWKRPDYPHSSCCNNKDCYPTEARFQSGSWFARRREDGEWLRIPPAKILHDEQTEDGKAHLCALPPESGVIYCFKKPEAGS
jgi:hypothetical protein